MNKLIEQPQQKESSFIRSLRMEKTLKKIMLLVSLNYNDADLGAEIRKLYNDKSIL
jgi:hypothetical protein